MKKKLQVPKETKNDKIHSLVKGAIGSIPCAGSIASEAFGLIVAQPITKRREKWMESVVLEIEKLEKIVEGFKFESLKDNDEFITFLIEATQIAIKTHQDEKISYLKNSINNFFNKNIDFDKKYTILKLIDNLSSTHLNILHFISDNEINIQKKIKGFEGLLELYCKENKIINKDYFRKFVRDLENASLIRLSGDFEDFYGGSGYIATDSGAPSIKLLDSGKDFIDFIYNTC